jgi:hypothetical protein
MADRPVGTKYIVAAPAALAAFCFGIGVSNAGDLPADIWSGKHEGHPSITATRDGISVTIPGKAIEDAGEGSITTMVQNFLQTHGPSMCSDVFDFNAEHKGMKVQIGIMGLDASSARFRFYTVSPTYGAVAFDYKPSKKVNCVTREPPIS